MHAFDVLSDPVRRRILQLLSDHDHSSGEIVDVVREEFGITQSAISQHLKVLRNNGFAAVSADGARRIYALDPSGFETADEWLAPFRRFWAPKFESLATEIARGKRQRRKSSS